MSVPDVVGRSRGWLYFVRKFLLDSLKVERMKKKSMSSMGGKVFYISVQVCALTR